MAMASGWWRSIAYASCAVLAWFLLQFYSPRDASYPRSSAARFVVGTYEQRVRIIGWPYIAAVETTDWSFGSKLLHREVGVSLVSTTLDVALLFLGALGVDRIARRLLSWRFSIRHIVVITVCVAVATKLLLAYHELSRPYEDLFPYYLEPEIVWHEAEINPMRPSYSIVVTCAGFFMLATALCGVVWSAASVCAAALRWRTWKGGAREGDIVNYRGN